MGIVVVRGDEKRRQITFLLGKPLPSRSIIADVVERVHHSWATVILHRPVADAALPQSLFDSNLIVQRGLDQAALVTASRLESAGLRCVNPVAATQRCNDRATVISLLDAARIPVPATVAMADWEEIRTRFDGRPIVVKSRAGNMGRGAAISMAIDGVLPIAAPFDGPYIVQTYLENNPTVRKLYVAGSQTRGLLKSSPILAAPQDAGIPFEVDAELVALTARIADALDLDVFGADVITGPNGLTVVDVNPFPGFRGVDNAGRLVADHLLELSRSI